MNPRPSLIDRPNPHSDEYEVMIDSIVEMILVNKMTTNEISKWLRFESGYNYGRTQSYAIAKAAFDVIASIHTETRRNTVENAFSELTEQLQDAKKSGNTRLMLDIQKEINKITGLYKENVDIDINHTIITKWGDEV